MRSHVTTGSSAHLRAPRSLPVGWLHATTADGTSPRNLAPGPRCTTPSAVVQDDSATVSRSGSTNHADGAERTADVGSPDRDVGRSAASCSQRIQSDSKRGSPPGSVLDDFDL
jgi:hypothetical protein